MAWNQSGGNGGRDGGRDPWGDRSGQQGPPDLDEVLSVPAALDFGCARVTQPLHMEHKPQLLHICMEALSVVP